MEFTDDKLPRFERPPVVEVALSVQFQPVQHFGAAHLGLVWQRFRDRFPKPEQHHPIQHQVERIGARSGPAVPQVTLLADAELTPRLWMINEAGSELVQVQPDRFIRNWRRYSDPQAKYPHYNEHIRPEFQRDFETFAEFVKQEGLGVLEVDQCEVTYINHISSSGTWTHHGELARVFKGWSNTYGEASHTPAESIGVRVRHAINDESGEFAGRLHIDIDSAFKPRVRGEESSREAIFVMQLVARGRPLGEGVDGIMGFLDFGRRHIVNTFARVTTDEMHAVWRRTQ